MISSLFHTLLYQPFYNGLIFFIVSIPGGDVGVAIVALTITVKALLFALSYRSTKNQALLRIKMSALEPELSAMKEKYKGNRSELGAKTLELYRKHGVNPLAGFAGILALLMQIPVILALYFVFLRGGLPEINHALLYPFITDPGGVTMVSLGIVNVAEKSVVLAVVTGLTQFLHAYLTLPPRKKKESRGNAAKGGMADDLAQSMRMNMMYAFPVLIGFFAYSLSAAVAIYWITSNICAIGQDLWVKKRVAFGGNSGAGHT